MLFLSHKTYGERGHLIVKSAITQMNNVDDGSKDREEDSDYLALCLNL